MLDVCGWMEGSPAKEARRASVGKRMKILGAQGELQYSGGDRQGVFQQESEGGQLADKIDPSWMPIMGQVLWRCLGSKLTQLIWEQFDPVEPEEMDRVLQTVNTNT